VNSNIGKVRIGGRLGERKKGHKRSHCGKGGPSSVERNRGTTPPWGWELRKRRQKTTRRIIKEGGPKQCREEKKTTRRSGEKGVGKHEAKLVKLYR